MREFTGYDDAHGEPIKVGEKVMRYGMLHDVVTINGSPFLIDSIGRQIIMTDYVASNSVIVEGGE